MNKVLLLFAFCLSYISGYSQCKDCKEGKHNGLNYDQLSSKKTGGLPPDSSGGLKQSFVMQNVCGLNWQQTSVKVTTRYPTPPGTGLPATVPITFSSCNVDSVVRAYLYFNGSYQTAYAANPASVSITNPASVTFSYLADSIGTAGQKCWGETGTIAYRVDVTNCINGGGNYTIDLSGTGLTAWAVDGISFVIIYVDKSASYSGSITLYDGLYTNSGGSPKTQTFNGFNVCAATPTGQAFSILADMQSNVNGGINTETYNGTTQTFSNLFYNFCTVTTPLTAGQNTTTYTAYADDGGDCYSWVLAGLYWQNTTCQTCNPTVVATNTVGITPPRDTICQGDSVQLQAFGDSTYIWTPSTGLSCTSCPNPKASPNATTTYSVTGFIGCAIGTDTVTIVVEPRGTLSVTPSTQICTGDSVQLTVSGGGNYVWKPSSSLSCNTCTNPTATPTATTTYTVVSGTGGCRDSAMVTITVTTTPTLSVVPTNPTICEGGSVVLTASGASAYRWTPTTSLSCSSCPNPTASPTITTVYTIVGGNGICRDTLTDTVYVLPSPVASVIAKPDSVCQGDTILLTGTGVGTYHWSTGQTTSSIKVVPSSTTTYTLAVSNGTCADSVPITVYIAPLTTLAMSKNDTVCPNTPVTLTATGAGGTFTYKWNNGATTSSINVSDTVTTTYTATVYGQCDSTKKTVTVIVVPLPKPVIKGSLWKCAGVKDTLTVSGGTTYLWSNGKTTTTYYTGPINGDSTITLIAYNSLGCPDTTRIKITERIKPAIKPIPSAVTCNGSPVTLTANPIGTGPFTYKWSNGQTTSSITVNDTNKTTYTVTVSNGCPNTASVTVFPDIPSLSACCNKTIIIGDDTIINASGPKIVKYQWVDSNNVVCENPPICSIIKVSPTVTTTYTVIGTDSLGCQIERFVTIVVEVPCFNFTVPNVFTPNYSGPDGVNNRFYIKTEHIDGWSIYIYDRWGKEMFKSSDPSFNSSWTGVTEGGGTAPDGVYYYIISGTCQNTTYKKDGFLQLIR